MSTQDFGKVSIAIPSYNRAYIIGSALESALQQSYPDYEIVVVDDGSSDDTRTVVERFGSGKIRYVRHDRNRGYSAACNTCVSAADGEFIAFLDSDDQWKPDYLQTMMDFLSRNPAVELAFCDTEIEIAPGEVRSLTSLLRVFPALLKKRAPASEYLIASREMYLCLLEEVPIKPTAAVIRRALFEREGTFNEDWPSGTDWDLFLRFAGSATFGYVDRALAIQSRTPDCTHIKFREKDQLFVLRIFLSERAKLSSDGQAIGAIDRGIAKAFNNLGWEYLRSGQRAKSAAAYFRGFRCTGRPGMLLRAASAAMPDGVRTAVRGFLRRAEKARA